MQDIIIKQATQEDRETLRKIGRETFQETFAESNTAENMAAYLDEKFAAQQVQQELDNAESSFFIAWQQDRPLGYLKLNSGAAQTEPQGDEALEIERIYIYQKYQANKIGQLLYNHAVAQARAMQKTVIWLAVWEENKRAIAFYEKNGFELFDKHIFKLGDDEQTDLMMRQHI